jgi:TolC family type I secretion outer membrane protein
MILMLTGCYERARYTPAITPSKELSPEQPIGCIEPDEAPVKAESQPATIMTLAECIETAVAENGSVRIADRRILIAKDRVREAWAIDLPKLTAEGRFDVQDQESALVSSGAAAAAASAGLTQTPKVDRDVSSATINLLVPVYDFGYGYHQRQAARHGVDVSRYAADRTRQDLALMVSQAYYRVLEAQKIKMVLDESIQTVQRQLVISRDFLEEGLVAKNDVLVAEVQLATRQQELIQAENNIQLAMATLNRLMNQSVNREMKIMDVMEVEPWKGSFDTIFRLAINNRPDLGAIRKQVDISEEEYRSARAQLMPKFDAYMRYGYTDSHDLPEKDVEAGGIVATIPIFEGGANYARMIRRNKEINEAIDRLSESEKDVILDVKKAYLNLNDAAQRVPVARKNIELATENLRITRDQYSQGLLTSADVLQEEERLALARSRYYQALYGYHEAFAVLKNVIGTDPPVSEGKNQGEVAGNEKK